MAKTFSLKSSSYQGRYMELTCTQTSNGSAKNSSTIKWTLTVAGQDDIYYTTGATKVIINGTTVYSKARTNWDKGVFPVKVGSVSGTITVNHDNLGNAKIPVQFSTAIYTSTVSTYKGDWTLDSIPRYATCSQVLGSRSEIAIGMGWSSDSTIDYVWYSKDNGTTWTAVGDPSWTSGSYTISGLNPNTTYQIKTRVRRADSQLTTDSSAMSVTTYDYPKPISTNNFIIGNGAVVGVSNPLGREYKLEIIAKHNNIILGTSTGTYNGDVAVGKYAHEINTQYQSIPNAPIGQYYAKVTYDGNVRTYDNGNAYQIKGDEIPTFNNFTYRDMNSTISNILGTDQMLVKGLSKLAVKITDNYKMIPNYYSNASNYVAKFDGLSGRINYGAEQTEFELGTPPNPGTLRLNVTAYDSRGLSKTAYKDVIVFDYAKPVVNCEVSRLNNFEAETTLKISGSYTKIIIDSIDKNALKLVEYRYKATDEEWTDNWTTAKATVSNNKFTCNDIVLDLDNTKAFTFQIRATDNFDSNLASGGVDVGQSIFFISSNLKNCYIGDEEIALKNKVIAKNSYQSGLDLNEINDTCFYYVNGGTNKPLANNGFVFTQYLNTNYKYQTFTVQDSGVIYTRVCSNGTWTAWKEIGSGGSSSEIVCPYRVGDILQSTIADDPKNTYPNTTWERLKDKFLLGAGDTYTLGATGGSATHRHTVGAHTHALGSAGWAKIYFGASNFIAKDKSTGNWTSNAKKTVSGSNSTASATGSYGVELGGATGAVSATTYTSYDSNMPPYQVVYMWKRTA